MNLSDPLVLTLAALAALLVGLSKGGLSLIGSVAVPMLALVISPVTAAALLLPIFVVSDMFGLWSYRREFDRRNLVILISAGVIGIGFGWATASIITERWVGFIVGLIGVTFCFNAWRQRHVVVQPKPADVPRGVFWGTLMGFSSFVSHSGGPPYQVYVLPQQLPKTVYAGTTTIVFAVVNAVKLLPYWALGQFNASNLKTSAWLMPIAIAGTFIGVRLVRILPQRTYFTIVQTVLFLVSIKLIWDTF
ncbi:hypothetical protein HNQ60_000352 [Povalibacter uvarum]|uniref:Probable membrane transporter protein n=1 Tax=Povalibacter uvarum TaxID=732238 RepID=A0A841HFG0_9GAMM|nr:sulfite exporter TauE/SafE family protein [Povalibacter uvarum]MBB6091506.1 hypothetical protein [Povalibacter uvarum]